MLSVRFESFFLTFENFLFIQLHVNISIHLDESIGETATDKVNVIVFSLHRNKVYIDMFYQL